MSNVRLDFPISCNYYHLPSLTPYCTRWLSALGDPGALLLSFFYGFPSSVGRGGTTFLTRRPRARDIRFFLFSSPVPFGFPREERRRRAKPTEGEKWRHFFPRREVSRALEKTKRNDTKRNETLARRARSLARSFRRLFSSPSSRSIGYSPPLRRPAETPPPSSTLFLLLHHHHPSSPRRIYRWKPEAAIN